jgi:hypothetical protein
MKNKESLRSVSKNPGFLQLTALLLIGAEARCVHCPSCAQPPSAHTRLQSILPSGATQTLEAHGRSLGLVPSTHLPAARLRKTPLSHPAKARNTARQASSSRPIWIASARADGPSRVGTLSRDRSLCWVHGCAMERERPRLPRNVRTRLGAMNGVLPGLESAIPSARCGITS